MLIRAKVAHTQPKTLEYRAEGEVFEYDGKPYKHVEKVDPRKASADDEDEGGLAAADVTVKNA